jgi:ribosomal protein RSM22 (predicted rRNA methylase)
MLLVSHVLTELSEEHMERLRKVALAAGALIWVESATHQNARRFMEQIREKLLETGQWRVVAPCTHSGSCPMLPPEHARHWCHHFARVPSEVHQSAAWRELSKKLGVDLRVLPYSFLAMERIAHESPAVAPGFQRIIGEPREFKGHLRILQCGAEGLAERALQKRDAPALFKRLRSAESLPLYRWDEQDGRITGGHGVGDGPEAGSAAERT